LYRLLEALRRWDIAVDVLFAVGLRRTFSMGAKQ
jgi:hypothetical protein